MAKKLEKLDPELALIWKHTHPDFRGVIDGVRTILCNNPNTGGAEVVALTGLTLEERASKLAYAKGCQERGRRGW